MHNRDGEKNINKYEWDKTLFLHTCYNLHSFC